MSPSIVFIESNTTGSGHLFLKKAIEKRLQVIFITQTPHKYPFLLTELIHPLILDTHNVKEIITYLTAIKKNLSCILSTSEYFIEVAAEVAKHFNLPCPNIAAVKLCRNKDQLAQFLQKHHINSPRTVVVSPQDPIQKVLNSSRFNFPIIIKPLSGSGSMGVRLCGDEKEYDEHIQNPQNSIYFDKKVLIQEYIVGEEYSVESMGFDHTIEIIGITKKYLGNPPHFIETGHDFPANLPSSLSEKINTLVKTTLQAINLTFGPAHTEIRVKDNEPYIIEINPRLAGGMIPTLIKNATGIDLIDEVLGLFMGEKIPSAPLFNKGGNDTSKSNTIQKFSSIRFIIPPCSGNVININIPIKKPQELIAFEMKLSPSEYVHLNGDFRDRKGYLITCADTLKQAKEAADTLVNAIKITISDNIESTDTGRLKETLSLEIQQLLSLEENTNPAQEFNYLATIDQAHLQMLYKQNIITAETLECVLEKIQQWKEENFAELVNKPAPRGFYLLYENALIQALGIDIAGQIHTARSRNDINATLFHLRLKAAYMNVYKTLWQFRSELITQVKAHEKIPLPIYSQYQTALPGTLAHYLLGIETALERDQKSLKALYEDIDTCPLGACAGGGTSFPIDAQYTASLLGFSKASTHSLDAVASRDLALRILSTLTIAGMTLSRFAEDLQLWSTNEFGFIDFPDHLTGCSSMMPQKKNPYLLEKIKGQLSSLIGQFVTATTTMYKVPFGNSVEIGTEAIQTLFPTIVLFTKTVSLFRLVIKDIYFIEKNITASLNKHLTMATYVVEMLVQKKQWNFREAHHQVGKLIREAIDANEDPLMIISAFAKNLSLDLNPKHAATHMEYGGGPGQHSVNQLDCRSIEQLNIDANWIIKRYSRV